MNRSLLHDYETICNRLEPKIHFTKITGSRIKHWLPDFKNNGDGGIRTLAVLNKLSRKEASRASPFDPDSKADSNQVCYAGLDNVKIFIMKFLFIMLRFIKLFFWLLTSRALPIIRKIFKSDSVMLCRMDLR